MSHDPVLRPIARNELTEQQRPLYDSIVGGRKTIGSLVPLTDADGALAGPFDPILRTPAIGAAVSQLGLALRNEASLPRRVNEAAILTTAVRWEGRFEWFAHEAIVRDADLIAGADIAAIRDNREPADTEIALAWRAANAVLQGQRLPAQLTDEVVQAWGERGLVELCVLVGHYTNLALLMQSLAIEPRG
jgi:4-carboxymuconolactone decarboxylase